MLYRKYREKFVTLREFIVMKENSQDIIQSLESREYQYGFTTDIETETLPKGLNEDIVRAISQRKGEPEWMMEYRLKAYRHWLTMSLPTWAHLNIPPIDFQDIIYYADCVCSVTPFHSLPRASLQINKARIRVAESFFVYVVSVMLAYIPTT